MFTGEKEVHGETDRRWTDGGKDAETESGVYVLVK
jgi:hypothetical protein